MNKLTIIGNLTKDPALRIVGNNISVCSFTVAVNRRKKGEQRETDYFKVTAWRELGENCSKYLSKGRKVAVVGEVALETCQGKDGKTYADLCVNAQDVEFLSAKAEQVADPAPMDSDSGYTQVDDEELPF